MVEKLIVLGLFMFVVSRGVQLLAFGANEKYDEQGKSLSAINGVIGATVEAGDIPPVGGIPAMPGEPGDAARIGGPGGPASSWVSVPQSGPAKLQPTASSATGSNDPNAKIRAASVKIRSRTAKGIYTGSGTLIEFAPGRYGVLTNEHVAYNVDPKIDPNGYHLSIGNSEVPVWTTAKFISPEGANTSKSVSASADIAILFVDSTTLSPEQQAAAVSLQELAAAPRFPISTLTAGFPVALGEELSLIEGKRWRQDPTNPWLAAGEQPLQEEVNLAGLSGGGVYSKNMDGDWVLGGVHRGGYEREGKRLPLGGAVPGPTAHAKARSLLADDADGDGIPNTVDRWPTLGTDADRNGNGVPDTMETSDES